jgi:hypothetical protein
MRLAPDHPKAITLHDGCKRDRITRHSWPFLTLGKYWLSVVPTMTGASTNCTTLMNIAWGSTGTNVPTYSTKQT